MCRQCVADVMYGHEKNTPIDEEAWDAIEWPAWTADMERCSELVGHLYSLPECAVGGPLHVLTDDFNVEDGTLDFCADGIKDHWSVQRVEPIDAVDIATTATKIIELTRSMTIEERITVLAHVWGYIE